MPLERITAQCGEQKRGGSSERQPGLVQAGMSSGMRQAGGGAAAGGGGGGAGTSGCWRPLAATAAAAATTAVVDAPSLPTKPVDDGWAHRES